MILLNSSAMAVNITASAIHVSSSALHTLTQQRANLPPRSIHNRKKKKQNLILCFLYLLLLFFRKRLNSIEVQVKGQDDGKNSGLTSGHNSRVASSSRQSADSNGPKPTITTATNVR